MNTSLFLIALFAILAAGVEFFVHAGFFAFVIGNPASLAVVAVVVVIGAIKK